MAVKFNFGKLVVLFCVGVTLLLFVSCKDALNNSKGVNTMPYNPPRQDISVTLNKYEKEKADSNAASKAFLSINDELVGRGWFEKFDNFPDTMPHEVRTFFYILYADNEINNGGFAQYFSNGYGKYAANAVAAFNEIGAPKKAVLLATVMASFPDGKYPQSIEDFNDLGEIEDAENALEFLNGDFDSKYYQSGENIDELILAYVKNHFDKFAP